MNYTNKQPPQRGGAVLEPVWVGSKWLLAFSRVPVTPGTPLEPFFCDAAPWNDCGMAANGFCKIGCMSSPFSCLFYARLRLLILLLVLLMSGNVHSNPGPIFPCSVCAGNVTSRGKSVQCCACSKWVHLKCSLLSLSNFRILGSSHSWSCSPAAPLLVTLWLPPLHLIVTLWLLPQTSPTCIPSLFYLALPSANAALSPHPRLQTSYRRFAHSVSSSSAPSPLSLAPGCPSTPQASSFPLDSLRVLQWNAGGLQARSTELLHFF